MFNNFIKLIFSRHLFVITLTGGIYFSSAAAIESGITLPLSEDAWVVLSYNKIPSNSVIFATGSLAVKVKSSASPIVHKLEKVSKVAEFFIKGKVTGSKAVETTTFDEDSVLRFGLVATGKQTLTGAKKWFAADWVKRLFSLVPEGPGLDKIYFFNFTNRASLLGKFRTHPKSDLIVENIFAETKKDQVINVSKKIEPPIEVAAIWISIDGDDSKSEYETLISEIKLRTAQ